MTDVFAREKRSWIMSRVGGKDTKPELVVRSLLHQMGYRFRLHRRDLPGTPDIVLPRFNKVIFVNGCFWHGHKNCSRSKRPTSNVRFWNDKLDATQKRDKLYRKRLKEMGWRSLVVWECESRKPSVLLPKLERFLDDE